MIKILTEQFRFGDPNFLYGTGNGTDKYGTDRPISLQSALSIYKHFSEGRSLDRAIAKAVLSVCLYVCHTRH